MLVIVAYRRCREKQRKEASRLQTVNRKLSAMNKLLMEENDRLQKQVSHLVYENGYMRQQLHTVRLFFFFLFFFHGYKYNVWSFLLNSSFFFFSSCCYVYLCCFSFLYIVASKRTYFLVFTMCAASIFAQFSSLVLYWGMFEMCSIFIGRVIFMCSLSRIMNNIYVNPFTILVIFNHPWLFIKFREKMVLFVWISGFKAFSFYSSK